VDQELVDQNFSAGACIGKGQGHFACSPVGRCLNAPPLVIVVDRCPSFSSAENDCPGQADFRCSGIFTIVRRNDQGQAGFAGAAYGQAA
jgi:hypothetical protein